MSDPDAEAERVLIERAPTDPDALSALYRLHVNAVHGYAYRRTGSTDVAEEITSATFERALRSLPGFEWRGIGLRPWLMRIASNEVVEHYRRSAREQGRRGQLALRALADPGGADDGHAPPVERDALQVALDRLPARYRDVITLRYLGGCSADEAAAELGCSRATVATVLHRALRALRRELDRMPRTS